MAARKADRLIAKVNIAALARQHGEAAIRKLADAMNSEDMRVAVDAASRLLDRGYGKPTQTIAHEDKAPESMSDAELLAAIRQSALSGADEKAARKGVTH